MWVGCDDEDCRIEAAVVYPTFATFLRRFGLVCGFLMTALPSEAKLKQESHVFETIDSFQGTNLGLEKSRATNEFEGVFERYQPKNRFFAVARHHVSSEIFSGKYYGFDVVLMPIFRDNDARFFKVSISFEDSIWKSVHSNLLKKLIRAHGNFSSQKTASHGKVFIWENDGGLRTRYDDKELNPSVTIESKNLL